MLLRASGWTASSLQVANEAKVTYFFISGDKIKSLPASNRSMSVLQEDRASGPVMSRCPLVHNCKHSELKNITEEVLAQLVTGGTRQNIERSIDLPPLIQSIRTKSVSVEAKLIEQRSGVTFICIRIETIVVEQSKWSFSFAVKSVPIIA